MSANTYVIDLCHYLDNDGVIADLPGPALNLAMVLASLVAWATDHEPETVLFTNVWCWRRPGRKRCRGELIAEVHQSSEICWHCPVCGVNGVIRGWEHTQWDRRGRSDGGS